MLIIKISNEKIYCSNIRATKLLIIILLIFISPFLAFGQRFPGGVNPNENDTFEKESQNNVIFSISLKFAKINNVYGTELGGNFTVLFDKKLGVGFEFFSLLSSNAGVKINESNSTIITYGYAGPVVSYTFMPADWMMLTPGMLFGISRVTNSGTVSAFGFPSSSEDWYGIIEPKVNLGVKIYKSVWLGIFAGYRYSYGVKYYSLDNKALSGPVFGISFINF